MNNYKLKILDNQDRNGPNINMVITIVCLSLNNHYGDYITERFLFYITNVSAFSLSFKRDCGLISDC